MGDLGTEETKIDQRLTKWFDLAEAWNAVLLVDEAEVFLEKRQTRDLARNGLVAGMSRCPLLRQSIIIWLTSASIPTEIGVLQRPALLDYQ